MLKEKQADIKEDKPSHVRKDGAAVNKRLLTGLIVSLIVMVALAIGAGVAVSGLNWYGEEVDGLTSDNASLQELVAAMQSTLADAKQELEETESQAAADKAALEEKIASLETELDALRGQLADAQDKIAELKGELPVYPADAKLVALTFDDGPAASTGRLLDILKAKRVKATFFMLGIQAEKSPALVARVAEEGHVIGNHSYSHKNLKKMTAEEATADLDKCSDILFGITGKRPTLMRPPGGNYDDMVVGCAKSRELRIINWSVDTRDWESKNRDAILATAFQEGAYGVQDGAIVLMHDVHPTTIDAVEEMIDRLQEQGYTLVTVPELLRVRADGGEDGGVYRILKAG